MSPLNWEWITNLFHLGLPFIEGLFLILMGVLCVVAVILDEASAPLKEWVRARWGLADPGQTVHVRRYAVRLTSRRRAIRLEAAERLGDLNDTSAVPALLRAVERYRDDGPFLEVVVQSLGRLRDPRALPALRTLSSGRHRALMERARAALAQIEPQATLLRGAESPPARAEGLLRPASPGDSTEPERLLRSSQDRS